MSYLPFQKGYDIVPVGLRMISPLDFQRGQATFPEGPEGQGNFSSRVC